MKELTKTFSNQKVIDSRFMCTGPMLRCLCAGNDPASYIGV